MLCSTLLPPPKDALFVTEAKYCRLIQLATTSGAVRISSSTDRSGSCAASYSCRNTRPPRSMPRVRARGAAMKAALPARPHSGRVSAQSRARVSSRARLGRRRPRPAARSARTSPPARARAASVSASGPSAARGTAAWSSTVTVSVAVSCSAATKLVRPGIGRPRAARCSRTCGSLSSRAAARALSAPPCPPQAPQSSAAANGLLALVPAWPTSSTSGASAVPRDMPRRIPAAISAACSSGRFSRSAAFAASSRATAAPPRRSSPEASLATKPSPTASTAGKARTGWPFAAASQSRGAGGGTSSASSWGAISAGQRALRRSASAASMATPKKPAKPSVAIPGATVSSARRMRSERTSMQKAI